MAPQFDRRFSFLRSPNDAIAIVSAIVCSDGWIEGELIFVDKEVWQSAIELVGEGDYHVLVKVPPQIQGKKNAQLYFDQGFKICQKQKI